MPLLRTAADPGKDQSYVLAALAPESLARLRFPLGAMRKAQVRELAAAAGLAVARKRDSQDLCFLAGTRQGAFLERHGGWGAAGADRRSPGEVLGEHAGAHTFTVGQRHGLGIGGGEPLYVLATDTSDEHGHGRPARGAAVRRRAGARGDAAPRRRLRRRREGALARAALGVPAGRRGRARGATST